MARSKSKQKIKRHRRDLRFKQRRQRRRAAARQG